MCIKSRYALIFMGIWVCLAFGTPVGCVSLTFHFMTHMYHYMIGDTPSTSYLINSGVKRVNILRLFSRDDTTSCRSGSQGIVFWGNK